MRNESNFDDAGVVLLVIALGLMAAVVISLAQGPARDIQSDQRFVLGSPLIAAEPEVRVNQLPQINSR